MKFVSVIILNWNEKKLLKECLDSLKKQTYMVYEVIVVDNASTDGSVEFIREEYPEVNLVSLRKNKGFTGGNIEGFKLAKGDFVALVNNDVVLDKNWLLEMVSLTETEGKVGIWASKILHFDMPNQIDSSGDGCTTSGHGFKVGNMEDTEKYNESQFRFGSCAAATLYRKKMIDEIGFFDEDFFLNCEDTDFNFRAQLMGWKCLYVPKAISKHRVSASVGKMSDLSVYHLSRNEEFVYLKNMPLYFMIRYFHHKIIQEIFSFLYFGIKKRKWKPFLKGKIDALKKIPLLIQKRKKIQKEKRVSDDYLRKILTPIFDKGLLKSRVSKLLFP